MKNNMDVTLFLVDDEKEYMGRDGKTHHSYSWAIVADHIYQFITPNTFKGKVPSKLRFMPYYKITRSELMKLFNAPCEYPNIHEEE